MTSIGIPTRAGSGVGRVNTCKHRATDTFYPDTEHVTSWRPGEAIAKALPFLAALQHNQMR
jgi:hypothetical protein